MNKRQVIAHVMKYLDLLAEGVDPISQETIPGDSVACRPQMKKCFQFVSAILEEVLRNNGLVLLDVEDASAQAPDAVAVTVNGSSYEMVRKKAAFRMTEDQRREVMISRLPITPNEFLKNVNRTVNPADMEKLSIKSVNAWLQKKGYVAEEKTQAVINRTVWRPTREAQQMGFMEMDVSDVKTGEIRRQLMYTTQAQEFLLDHMEEIAATGK